MKPTDVCLAVLVAVIWGLAFVASRLALDEFSPALMTTLRFGIAAVPCLFVRKPDVSWPLLIGISFTLFLGQFLAQAYGIAHGVPVGLSSVIVQSQALFTVAFAAVAFSEIPTRPQALGIGVATLGLLLICGTVGYDFSISAFAVLMICPVSFAIGNLLLRRAKGAPMFDLFAWLCLVAALPLLALTLVTDGAQPTWHAVSHMSLTSLVCMLALGGIFHQHRLLAVGPAAPRLHGDASGAVCVVGAVRRLRGFQYRFPRTVWTVAACRNAHCGRRHRHHVVVEAAASLA